MIQTGNAELDAVINTLQVQRNEAMDAIALMASKLKAQELLAADLQKKLDEALKPKESSDAN